MGGTSVCFLAYSGKLIKRGKVMMLEGEAIVGVKFFVWEGKESRSLTFTGTRELHSNPCYYAFKSNFYSEKGIHV